MGRCSSSLMWSIFAKSEVWPQPAASNRPPITHHSCILALSYAARRTPPVARRPQESERSTRSRRSILDWRACAAPSTGAQQPAVGTAASAASGLAAGAAAGAAAGGAAGAAAGATSEAAAAGAAGAVAWAPRESSAANGRLSWRQSRQSGRRQSEATSQRLSRSSQGASGRLSVRVGAALSALSGRDRDLEEETTVEQAPRYDC